MDHNTKTYVLYWIHSRLHTDYNTQGYIGVTSNFKKRMQDHARKSNPHLDNAKIKYGWSNLSKTILVSDLDEEAILLLEEMLRPKENIGWNVTVGGGKPPARPGNKSTLGKCNEYANNYKGPIKATCLKTNKVIQLLNKQDIIENGFSPSHVYAVITGKRKHHLGYTFER